MKNNYKIVAIGFKNNINHPFVGCLLETGDYYMIINPKRDLKRLKQMEKEVKKIIKNTISEDKNKTLYFSICGWLS